jgi:hypothetical protein
VSHNLRLYSPALVVLVCALIGISFAGVAEVIIIVCLPFSIVVYTRERHGHPRRHHPHE